MRDFRVAVIIPLFNKAPHIRATLESVLAQSLAPVEVVIVDDQSTDGSIAAIADLIAGPVRLVCQANAGPGPTRNRGAAEASADWVALIDGDDLWAPDHLATLAAVASAVPRADVIATDYIEGECAAGPDALRRSVERPAPRLIDFFAESGGRSRLWTSATAIRRSVFQSSGGFGAFFPGEDIELWVRLALENPIAVSDARTAYYVRQTGGLMDQGQDSKTWTFGLAPHLETLEKRFDHARHAHFARSIAAYRAQHFRLSVRQSLYRGRPDIARQFIAKLRAGGAGIAPFDHILAFMPAALLRRAVGLRTWLASR